MSKLGVIVPYRNREAHLNTFIPAIKKKLKKDKIDYELIIVEQSSKQSFNRGKLLNIGVAKALGLGCTYVALHDVDMVPIDADYSYVDRPTHLATNFISNKKEKRIIFDGYFGGVTLFPINDFLKVNGYSNNYWGWGYEDDDLLFRCKENLLDFNTKQIPILTRNTAGLKFNGWDSYVKIPKPYGLDSYTILVSLEPDQLECNPELEVDEQSILAVPGYDTGFSYNTFQRYKFETWTGNKEKEVISLKSNIKPPGRVCLVGTIDQYNKLARFYIDGELVDEVSFKGRTMPYHSKDHIMIGKTGSPENGRKGFKGVIDYVATWEHCLEPGQVKAISDNLHMGVTENFEGYVNTHTLTGVYDCKASNNQTLYDISGKENHAEVFHCDRVSVDNERSFEEVAIPWRRECTFELLYHKDNGFYENKWTFTETRKNQIRYYNEVLGGKTEWRRDGLDSIKYKLLSDTFLNGYHFLSCEL